MRTSTPDFLIRLRESTRNIHQSVEVVVGSDQLLGDSPTRSHYRQFLSAHYLLHYEVACHSALCDKSALGSVLLDWPDNPRIRALSEDLEQLSVMIDMAVYPHLSYVSQGFTLGLVYVCEGSCIGNQRLLTNLNRHAEFHQWNSKSFLSTCKMGFADRWKALLALMEQVAEHNGSFDGSGYQDIERGAISGFQLYVDYWHALNLVTTGTTESYKIKVA